VQAGSQKLWNRGVTKVSYNNIHESIL
jgi:hypothetical protein